MVIIIKLLIYIKTRNSVNYNLFMIEEENPWITSRMGSPKYEKSYKDSESDLEDDDYDDRNQHRGNLDVKDL